MSTVENVVFSSASVKMCSKSRLHPPIERCLPSRKITGSEGQKELLSKITCEEQMILPLRGPSVTSRI